jgi:hypothetical protein
MISRSERHREGSLSLASNLLNGQAEDVDRKFIGRLLIGESESAASLPRPVSVIENLELDSLSLSWNDLNDLLRFAHADSASVFPALLALGAP